MDEMMIFQEGISMRRNRMSAVAISLAVVLGIGAAGAFPAVFAEQQNVTGDVNGDGVCDSRDVRQMQRYLLGAESNGVSAADVNLSLIHI